ncbi:maleylpyruvate isomerase N-terminal domain-containing protein [Streptomyces sp. P9-2B-2]|uniref:maleylpyruvate isomerase N-terminal domain-containing protein n=1 Tax=Streptomyces sp. P9-2B-2 TaxID=3057114 RepID=UPI0025B39D4E|nr:maleylpyruvate isomerase N-terminal domain-containing protein [Streptomyces sp. P9-2B-2]WJY41857.1 maleylpyruvate isomerase N-terminal domain-containing protein [Streptomyces sp. P9-2B-2]
MDDDEILRSHGEALALFGTRVQAVRDDQWDGPTPCTDWSVRALVGAEERLPDRLASAAMREVEPYARGLSASGLFAAAVEPPPDADALTRLLCLLGRRP